MLIHGNLDGQIVNQLLRWRLEDLNVDPGHTEARIAYNSIDDRVIVGRTVGYGRVAYVDDLLGLNKWKYDVELATQPGENLSLNGPATVDGVATTDAQKVLVKDQTDLTQNGLYIVNHSGAWVRSIDGDAGVELEGCMVIITQGTAVGSGGNKGTLRRNLDPDGSIVEWTTDIHFAQIEIAVPTEDRFVKISGTDIAEKYLLDAINNATVSTGPAINNQDIIKVIHVDPGFNETVAFGVDLSNYQGNLGITGDLIVSGTTTLHDLDFSANSTVDRTNTTQTGTTTYDDNYDATYDGSTVSYENGATNNYDETTTTNQGGTTNYTDTSNTTGEQNFDENYTANYLGSEINYGYAEVLIGCSGSQPVITGTPFSDPIDTEADYANVNVVYDQGGVNEWTDNVSINEISSPVVVTDPGATLDGQITITRDGVNIVCTKDSGANDFVVDVCQMDANPAGGETTINNDGTVTNNNDTITNNTDTTENNTGVNEYYDETSNVVNEGNVYNENLTVQNISYSENYVAGEALYDRQPVRQGVLSLGEDVDKIYGADATTIERSLVIGFASKTVAIDEALAVLQGPRVSGLKDVFGPLVDESEYKLQDDGTIGLVAGTIDIRLGDADGDDTLVGLNVPRSVLPSQTGYVMNTVNYTPAYNSYNVVTHNGDSTVTFPTAVGHDGEWIRVKKFTGEDVFVVTIETTGSEEIDGFEGATMNIDRTMYTFTAVAGNRYLGD